MSGACIRRPRAGALPLPPPLPLCAAAVGRGGWSVCNRLARRRNRRRWARAPRSHWRQQQPRAPSSCSQRMSEGNGECVRRGPCARSQKKQGGWEGVLPIALSHRPEAVWVGGCSRTHPPHDRGTRRSDKFSRVDKISDLQPTTTVLED